MYFPNESIASREEDLTQVPVTGFAEYIGASLKNAFLETTTATSMLGHEATAAEIEQYPDTEKDLRAAISAEADSMGFVTQQELRLGISALPRLSEDQWRKSRHYRQGMKYEPDITEARLKVYADWYDEKKKRDDSIARRNAGFIDGTAGFLAGLVGSIPDPINFISYGVAPGAAAAKRIALAAAENMAAEQVIQLSTASQREAAGIQLSGEEKLLNTAFAGIIGGAFGGMGAAFRARAEAKAKATGQSVEASMKFAREGVVVKGADGKLVPTTVDAKPSVKVLTDTALATMPTADKVRILSKLADALDRIGDTGRLQRAELGSPDTPHVDVAAVSKYEQVFNDVFRGDDAAGKSLAKAIGYEDVDIAKVLITEKQLDTPTPVEAIDVAAMRIDKEPIENVAFVSDKDNITLDRTDIPGDEYPMLQGKTLFEVADREIASFSDGIVKAVELVNTDGCK